MAGRRTSTQEMMARLEVIEEEDAVTRSSVEGVHNKTSASAKVTLVKINTTLQEMQLEIAAYAREQRSDRWKKRTLQKT